MLIARTGQDTRVSWLRIEDAYFSDVELGSAHCITDVGVGAAPLSHQLRASSSTLNRHRLPIGVDYLAELRVTFASSRPRSS